MNPLWGWLRLRGGHRQRVARHCEGHSLWPGSTTQVAPTLEKFFEALSLQVGAAEAPRRPGVDDSTCACCGPQSGASSAPHTRHALSPSPYVSGLPLPTSGLEWMQCLKCMCRGASAPRTEGEERARRGGRADGPVLAVA